MTYPGDRFEPFQDFLKEYSINAQTKKLEIKFKAIPVRDLGEWAWRELQKYEGFLSRKLKYAECKWGEWNVFRDIAIACLGEKEIQKRLKAWRQKNE